MEARTNLNYRQRHDDTNHHDDAVENTHVKSKVGVSAQTTHPMGRQSILLQVVVTSVRSSWLLLRNLHFEALMHIVHITAQWCHPEQSMAVVVVVLLLKQRK